MTLQAESTQTVAPLLRLPPEVIDQITAKLPYTSTLALSWACRQLYNHVDTKQVQWSASSRLDTIFDLLIIEKWPAFDLHLACAYCHKILPRSSFTLRQLHRYPKTHYKTQAMLEAQSAIRLRTKKGGEPLCVTRTKRSFGNSNEADLGVDTVARLCINCGVRDGRYHKGELFHFPLDVEMSDSGSTSSDSSEEPHGTGIVCKKCGVFKTCDAGSVAATRRICWDCLSSSEDPALT